MSVLGRDLKLVLEVHLVGNYDPRQLLAGVLLLNTCVPVVQKAEGFLVSRVIHEHHLICLAEQVECDILEDVLPRDVNHVEFDESVAASFNGHLLQSVLTPLRHHIIVIELLPNMLVDNLSLADAGFARNDHA